MRDLIEFGGVVVFGMIIITVFTGILSIPIFFLESAKCADQWENRESRFEFFAGCLVEHEGEMIPSANLRFEGETNE